MENKVISTILKPKNVEWNSPERLVLDLGTDNESQTYELLKGAKEFLHKQIDVKVATSKELYKLDETIWTQLKNKQLDKRANEPNLSSRFELTGENIIYLGLNDGSIADIQQIITEEYIEKFEKQHQQFVIDFTTNNVANKFYMEGKDDTHKFVFYDKNTSIASNTYTPIVIVELNHIKAEYIVYTGIYIYSENTLIPSINMDMERKSLCDFISSFDLKTFLDRANEKAEELYDAYKRFLENPIKISVRELTTILKKVGYKVEPDKYQDDVLKPIDNFYDEANGKRIENFYNSFKFITGEDVSILLLKLNDFRKTFRYNDLTILDVLAILSKEYLTYNDTKIKVSVLSDIVYKLYDSNSSDNAQVELIEKENENR